MGGWGSGWSGRRRGVWRRTVEEYAAIRVGEVVHALNGRHGDATIVSVELRARNGPPTLVQLVSRPQPFGGRRWDFRCPACKRQCRVLYLGLFCGVKDSLACRLCRSLVYRSQRIATDRRWERRAQKLIDRAGQEASDGLIYPHKGMHRRTFDRLMDEAQLYNEAAVGYRLRSLPKALRRLFESGE